MEAKDARTFLNALYTVA